MTREQMARYLNLHPDSTYWPNDLLDHLIELHTTEGKEALAREVYSLLKR